MRHKYQSDLERATDILMFVSAGSTRTIITCMSTDFWSALGHETTSHTLTWLILELSRHPACLKKLQEALDNAIRNPQGGEEKFPSLSTVMGIEYLGCCINEAMRLWPVAGGGPKRVASVDIPFKQTSEDGCDYNMVIPKGSTITIALFSMFRQPWIEDADLFLPERWLPGNSQLPKLKELLIPFSSGKRNCIGMNLAKFELYMIAAYLLRYFQFELISKPKIEFFLTLKATNVQMKVTRRNESV